MRILASTRGAVGPLGLALMLAAAAGLASAKPTDEQLAAIKASCRSDFMANCWGVPRGGAEAFQCLKDHLASLSAPCQQAVKAVISAATPPASSGTAATAAKPAGETKPAAAAPDSAAAPASAGTGNTATTLSAGEAASTEAAPSSATKTGGSTEQGAPSPGAAAQGSAAVSASQPNAAVKKPAAASSAAVQGAESGAAAKASGAASAAKAKSAVNGAAAPVTPASTGSAAPPDVGFIPPRKKVMLARACRSDFNAHCPGVDLGEGRAVACLEANKATLTPDCREALAKIVP